MAGKPILTHCFEQLVELGTEEFVVGYLTQEVTGHYGDGFEGVPIEESSRYGVCVTNDYGEITEVVERWLRGGDRTVPNYQHAQLPPRGTRG